MRTRAFAALVRLESWRMLRNPLLLLAAAYGAWDTGAYWPDQALLDWGTVVDAAIDSAPFAAAGAFLAAFFPGSRERRYGAASSLPLPPRARTAALLAAAAAVGAVAAVPLVVAAVRPWSGTDIAGVLSPAALLIPSGIAAVAGAGGVAAGLWSPSWTLPALLIAAVPAYQLAWNITVDVSGIPGRGVVEGAVGLAAEMLLPGGYYSPGLWGMVPRHLGFLALLAAVCCGLAVVRAERRRGRPRLAAAAATAVFAAGASGVYTELHRMESRNQEALRQGQWSAAVGPVPDRVCERLILEYCGYETYESWFPYWQRTGESVAAAVPERARGALPRIEQNTYGSRTVTSDEVEMLRAGVAHPDGLWNAGLGWSHTKLAEYVALAAVGAPENLSWTKPCTLHGQARYPVLVWLVVHGAKDVPATLEEYLLFTELRPPEREVGLVLAMLERPDEEVIEALDAHWERLVDPATPSAEAAALLGVEVTRDHVARAGDILGDSWFGQEEGTDGAEEELWLSEDEGYQKYEQAPTTPCS